MNKVALFGCGSGLELFKKMSSNEVFDSVAVIFDNNAKSTSEYGIPVVNADEKECLNDEYSVIMITSRHFIDIYHQLLTYGVPEEKIQIFGGLLAY